MSKLTLQLSPEMERVLEQLANSRQLPKSQVLRRAVLLMQFLDNQVADDHDIVLKDRKTGETSRLVFESQMSEAATATPSPATSAPAEPATCTCAEATAPDSSPQAQAS